MKERDYTPYGKHYSEPKLWEKIKRVARKAGAKAVYSILLLYYVATDKNVPMKEKAKIYGALGYFILPFDLLPDAIPFVGYTDDLTALLWALHAVWTNITPEIDLKAKNKLKEWFKNIEDKDLKLF